MNYILSDIEGTLTTGSSWKAIRTYYKSNINPVKYNRFFLRWIPRYLLVTLGLASRRQAMFDWMADEVRLFQGMALERFREMADWVVEVEMWPKRRREILSEINQAQVQGIKVMVVSSAYQPIVNAFAKKLGAIPFGTPLALVEGCIKGIQNPVNAYEFKAERIQSQLGKSNIITAYGDTSSDISMMSLSRYPVAVYPDDELWKVAKARGWRIIA
jgi:phosphoserine phosphatase